MKQHYENDTAIFSISEGIFGVTIRPGTLLDQHTAHLVTNIRIGMQEEKALPVLYDFDGFTDSDKAGRDYLARHASLMAPAIAICATLHVPKTIAGFIISVSKPAVPCGLFTKEDAGKEFLRQYH